jgi:flagellin-specific chaperone FliS
MKKNALLKKIDNYENKIIDVIHELQDFLDHVEDPDISSMGNELCQLLIDTMYDNDIVSINNIKEFVQHDYDQ